MTTLGPDVREVLATQVKCAGNGLTITGQLDRPLYTATNKALEALGGKWSKKAKAHIFDKPAEEVIATILEANGYVCPKNEFDFFETPIALAERMAAMLDLKPGMQVLEPSAGNGRLAIAAAKHVDIDNVHCIEIQKECCANLRKAGFNHIVQGDFMEMTTGTDRFNFITMNPPFSNNADIKHVLHAAQFIKPGGSMVAIMSPHHTFTKDRVCAEFREWLDGGAFEETSVEKLPAGTFKESGTGVASVLVLMKGKR